LVTVFSADYRPSENVKFYIGFSDGGYIEDDVRYGLSLLNLNAGPGATTPEPSGFFKTSEGELESSLRYKNSEHHDNQVLQGGGRLVLGPVILDFRGSFATFQARYEITSTLQARFSYSTAIGRPTFGQITASTIINTVDRTITTGNPQLKPTTDNSFDLALDYYPIKGSYFYVGLFDKEIANYIFQRSIIAMNFAMVLPSTFTLRI